MAEAQHEKANLVNLLRALQSNDNVTRQQAEVLYHRTKHEESDRLMVGIMVVLGSSDIEEDTRRHGAVLMRQLVTRGGEKEFVFPRLTPNNQQGVANELLRRFEEEPLPKLQKKVGEVISKLAEHVCDKEDPRGSLAPGTCGWPALLPLVFRMADAGVNASAESCESAIRLLQELIFTMREDILDARQPLQQIVQNALMHANLRLRTAALLLICEIVNCSERKAWTPLLATVGVLVQLMQQLAANKEEDLLQEALKAFNDTALAEPDFFKPHLAQSMELPNLFATFTRMRDGKDDGVRNLALEWLVSYLEKKTKWVMKNVGGYAPLVLQCCMDFMLEMEDDEDVVKAWCVRMDDEEGDGDEEGLFHAGEEAIDRVVKVVQIDAIGSALSNVITLYASQDSWQARHAALAAIKQTVEYVEESHVHAMAQVLLTHLEHIHPRVRFMALHAIGQLANDQAPHFQESHHGTVMPTLLKMMDDSVDRVAAMAMSAFVSFGEELDTSLMLQYVPTFMEKVCAKLQVTKHRGIREESITSIAVIAGVIEKDFSKYYDLIMPMLKHFIMTALSERENRLRGKSFECMSLLGLAVGKERFLPDAKEAIAEMMKTPMEADNVQREYIKEASERICQCLKRDFAPFLPNLLEGMFQTLKLEDSPGPETNRNDDDCDDYDYVNVSTGDGEMVRVRTSRFEEMMQSVQLLRTFVTEIEGAYFDWVQLTANVLLPLLSAADDATYLCDEIRGNALHVWGLLIKAARLGAQERGLPTTMAVELLRTGLSQTFPVLENSTDPSMLGETASGITECVKNVGAGVFAAEEIVQIVARIFSLIDQSFARSKAAQKLKQDSKAPDDEDDDAEDCEGEERLRRNYEEVLGAVMAVAPVPFLQCLPQCAERIRHWIAGNDNKVLAISMGCDLIAHLKEKSEPVWPVFMPEVFRALGDANVDARTAAAHAINLAAPLPSFSEAAAEAFRRLAEVIRAAKPGRVKRDEKSRVAVDNAVAALFTLAKEKPTHCPPEIQAWSIAVSRLPLRDNEEEAKKIHEKLVELVLEDHQGLLGGPGRPNLGKVLSVLAEVYHVESLCKRELEGKILQVFKSIPVAVLKSLASGFTEKQRKKIEKMLGS